MEQLLELERRVRDSIFASRDPSAPSDQSDIAREPALDSDYSGDTIYRIDEWGETTLLDFCEQWARSSGWPFLLVAEGLPNDGRRAFPSGVDPAKAVFECIVDPIDGTRCLMYDKRSAWSLAAIAPSAALLGHRPTLQDIVVAVQTELPTSRARLADAMWAVAGQGTSGETTDLVTGASTPLRVAPSRALDLAHGFAVISKFFPGTKQAASWLEERLFDEVVGEHAAGVPLVFEDQYISSGGQLYELMVGHDRFIADLRPPLMDAAEAQRAASFAGATGGPPASGVPHSPYSGPPGIHPGGHSGAQRPSVVRRLCARPYDLCTFLIAVEAGVVVTDEWGQPLAAPLDTETDVAWIGYANAGLRDRIEPVLQRLLRELGAGRVAS